MHYCLETPGVALIEFFKVYLLFSDPSVKYFIDDYGFLILEFIPPVMYIVVFVCTYRGNNLTLPKLFTISPTCGLYFTLFSKGQL